MTLYKLTYPVESSGGNIEYQITQRVRKEADTSNTKVTVVTTGLSLEREGIEGSAIVEVSHDVRLADIFESTTGIRQMSSADISETPDTEATQEPHADPQPEDDISRFNASAEMANVVADVNKTPGRGFLLYSNLTRCHPYERDLWLVLIQSTELDANTELTPTDIVEFYRANLDLLEDEPALKIGCFHGVAESTIQLSLVASLTDPNEAKELAEQTSSRGAMNIYRFELSKESLVVGESTHGPGHSNAVFRNDAGDEVRSRELAYRLWYEGLDTSFHPLGVLVEGELYRPVAVGVSDAETADIGEPLRLDTYRGSASKPWQFGVTRHDGQLLMTQARGPPEKFDPVLKRFPIETQTVGDEPLVFSHTVSRRLWSEDPVNPQIQSQRSEGLQTQFLYADDHGWHLFQPKALGEPSEPVESSFESTQLDGVSVRSSLLRTETHGETKATVEHEYRIAAGAPDSCSSLFVLSYHEANEESIDRLQWEIADTTAYEIVSEERPSR